MTSGSELAAMEGRKFGLDQAMTGLSFVLLLVIVAIPIFMIVYNAFFYEGKFDISLFVSVIGNMDNLKAMWNTIVIALAVTLEPLWVCSMPGFWGAATFRPRAL